MECQTLRVDMEKEVKEERILVYRDKKPVGYYLLIMEFEGSGKKLRLTDKKKELNEEEPHF